MRRITTSERKLLSLISNAGGSVCPGVDFYPGAELRRTMRKLERAGILRTEETDDGPRFHLTELGRQEVENG